MRSLTYSAHTHVVQSGNADRIKNATIDVSEVVRGYNLSVRVLFLLALHSPLRLRRRMRPSAATTARDDHPSGFRKSAAIAVSVGVDVLPVYIALCDSAHNSVSTYTHLASVTTPTSVPGQMSMFKTAY